MPFGMRHPYREHSTYGITTLSAAERFIRHCENSASAATGSIPDHQAVNVSEMRTAARALEAAFLRGGSPYVSRAATNEVPPGALLSINVRANC